MADRCDWFLKNYTEDSTARVSKESFDGVIEALRTGVSQKCLAEHNHPLLNILLVDVTQVDFTIVTIDLRTKQLMYVRESKAAAISKIMKLPADMPDEQKVMASMSFVLTPLMCTLEDLERINVKPFKIIQSIKKKVDELDFFEEVEKATQQPALA